MTAHFYLMAESFTNNKILSNQEIEEKVKRLSEDVVLIYKYKETNKIYTNYNDIYPQVFYESFTIGDFLCRPFELKLNGIDRDVINSIQKIIDRSQETDITSKEVVSELLGWNDEDNCHGLIAFNKVENFDSQFQVIYGVDGWYKFRRLFLSIYPKNNIYFIDECSKYFPNLFFHSNNKVSVNKILHNCSRKIIYHLSALNDNFKKLDVTNLNRGQILEKFSIESKLDETATLEGNPNKKPKLTFDFVDKDHNLIPVCCEPHLKLCFNDNHPGDNSYSNKRRIYFHEGISTICDSRILIAHIGKHL